MNLSHFFSHTFCVPVMFSLSLSLFHCLRLCVSDFSPLHLLSSPLRPPLLSVSPPVERLSREGNDSVTAQFFFVYGSLNHSETWNLCVRNGVLSKRRRETVAVGWLWKICMKRFKACCMNAECKFCLWLKTFFKNYTLEVFNIKEWCGTNFFIRLKKISKKINLVHNLLCIYKYSLNNSYSVLLVSFKRYCKLFVNHTGVILYLIKLYCVN